MHTITWESSGIYLDLGEVFSIEDVLKSITAISGDLRFDNIHYRIVDYSKIITPDLSEINKIILFSSIQNYFNKSILEASITNNPEIIKSLRSQRVTDMYFSKVGVFQDIERAREWIKNCSYTSPIPFHEPVFGYR